MGEIRAMGLWALFSTKQIQHVFIERHKVRTRSTLARSSQRPRWILSLYWEMRVLYREIRFCITRYYTYTTTTCTHPTLYQWPYQRIKYRNKNNNCKSIRKIKNLNNSRQLNSLPNPPSRSSSVAPLDVQAPVIIQAMD